jgi:hypothetical protein
MLNALKAMLTPAVKPPPAPSRPEQETATMTDTYISPAAATAATAAAQQAAAASSAPPAKPAGDITDVTAPPTVPWHNVLDAEMRTYALKKGYDLTDPMKAFMASARGHMEAEKFIGVPPNRLLKLPEDVNDEAGWKAVYQRFGAPVDKNGYDFSQVKFSDGSDLDQSFAEFMRTKAFELHLPTTSAAALSQAFVGFMEEGDKRESEAMAQKLTEEKAQLQKDWGNNYEYNRQTAVQGAQKLKVTAEDVATLEKAVGYSRVMEIFRKVGAGTTEDSYISGKQGGEFMTTQQTAQTRLNELMANPQWQGRFLQNEPEARREFEQLTRLISDYKEEAA